MQSFLQDSCTKPSLLGSSILCTPLGVLGTNEVYVQRIPLSEPPAFHFLCPSDAFKSPSQSLFSRAGHLPGHSCIIPVALRTRQLATHPVHDCV